MTKEQLIERKNELEEAIPKIEKDLETLKGNLAATCGAVTLLNQLIKDEQEQEQTTVKSKKI